METKTNIIVGDVARVEDGAFLVICPDGTQYTVPVELYKGEPLAVDVNKYLQLNFLPSEQDEPNEDEDQNSLENSIPQDVPKGNCDETPNKVAEWSDNATKLLIATYKEKKDLVEQRKIKTMKRMWTEINEELKRHGHTYTDAQAENKWKTLERAFKKKIENNKSSGRGRKGCPYEKELSDVLIKRASIIPPVVMDSKSTTFRKEVLKELQKDNVEENVEENMDESPKENQLQTSNERPPSPTTQRRKRSRMSSAVEEQKKMRVAIEKRTEEKRLAEERKHEQRERLIALMSKKNELMEQYLNQRIQ